MAEENTIFVGNKPVMNYVLAVVTQFNNNASEVVLKARGMAISRAVDVAEIVRNKFVKDAQIINIKTSTETLSREDGSISNVSSIEISLGR